ncbi:MAG TPA: energy transducer TonB [Hanamia sp.]
MKTNCKLFPILYFSFIFFANAAKAQTSNLDSIYDKVEVEASFPGGADAWSKYISDKISDKVSDFGKKDYGTCIVRFIVDKTGKISNVEAMTMKDTKLAKYVIKAIEKGPYWVPAEEDGKKVNAYRLQPVTVTQSDQ